MNRRKFLKRAGQVLAGGMALTTKTKAVEPKSELTLEMLLKAKAELDAQPEYPIGTRKVMADGRVFRYCQVVKKGFVRVSDIPVGFYRGESARIYLLENNQVI